VSLMAASIAAQRRFHFDKPRSHGEHGVLKILSVPSVSPWLVSKTDFRNRLAR
jgi:hypothetical protein